MVLATVTDLFTGEVIAVVNECDDCGMIAYNGICGCQISEESYNTHLAPWGTDLSEQEQTRALLAWDEYYRRR